MIRLTWTSPDGTTDASWKFGPETPEDKVLDLMERACGFVRRQRGEYAAAVEELEEELYPERNGRRPIPPPEKAPPPEDAERIPMLPPAAVSDRPSDGGPPNDGFGWASMPTNAIPEHLTKQWEMVPEDER